MEQQQVINRFFSVGETSIKGVLEALAKMTKLEGRDLVRALWQKARPMEGEQKLYRFMSEKSMKDSVTLPESFNTPANLEELKKYLAKKHVPFAYNQNGDKTELFFQVKNERIIRSALADMLEDIQNPDHELWECLNKKSPKTAADRVKEARAERNTQGQKQTHKEAARPKKPMRPTMKGR
ncbi:hypothetical protein [Fructobacillus fructosus]|uniref:PcfB family protein n=1 Tax=Fructobacillus fructosus TaxID=1631 RepID=A0ABN9YXQ6_9LACO|nr:hypothetical protein LMG30235_GOPAMIKF_00348 [Fructobacillus fructosus]CAK1229155.1 hypothetical protein LMG30234_GAICNKDF_00345 [Fructobacillus fructosus]CAK1235585.1 hypothetical protein R54866_LGPIEIPA_00641 [Fructobacillus fructosus]CAK1245924.1 hypothetical protein R53140_OCIKHKEL_01154 [Fructobacillus fructosus]CAK1252012.1 hypothetical protein R54839_PPFHFPJH_01423 [Fructobacillus fructosus]